MSTALREPLRFQRTLPASPEEAFRAWTDPASLGAWMRPGEGIRTEARCDVKVGGRFEIVMHGEENVYVQHGEYLEIDPPKRLVFSWVSEALPEARTRVTVEFAPAEGGDTLLTLVHEDMPEGDAYAGYENGWNRILEHLAEALGS